MTTLFISDLHLDDSRPVATQWLLDFLAHEAVGADALYILGDLFEYWLGDDAPSPTGQRVAEGLSKLSSGGVPCYFMHGNRDFLLGEDYARQAGFELLPEEIVVDLYGLPALLLHGDTLCTDDVAYQQFRRMVRDPQWQADFLQKSPSDRIQFALEAREMSAEHKAGVDMEIMDVNEDAVRAAFERTGVRRLIHGHTHRPSLHEHALPDGTGQRIVLGAWFEQGSVLRITPEGVELGTL